MAKAEPSVVPNVRASSVDSMDSQTFVNNYKVKLLNDLERESSDTLKRLTKLIISEENLFNQ